MTLAVYVFSLVVVIILYNVQLAKERRFHREEVNEILKRAEVERKELHDRLMSRSLGEYTASKGEKPKSRKPRNFLKEQIEKAYREG